MRKAMTIRLTIGLFLLGAVGSSIAETPVLNVENGFIIPAKGTLRVLLIFAQVDYSQGDCAEDVYTRANGNTWGENRKGETLVPADAAMLFDHQMPAGREEMKGLLSRFFYDASLGQHILLGDYYPEVITVPCGQLTTSPQNHLEQVVAAINEIPGEFRTAAGLRLDEFDLWDWNPRQPGLEKSASIGRQKGVDVMMIIWRNNVYMAGIVKNVGANCNAGFGLTTAYKPKPLKQMTGGVQTISSYNGCKNAESAAGITLGEYFHGLYGGNHWHTGGGAGLRTFLTFPFSYSITGQNGGKAAAWDRWMIGWYGWKNEARTERKDHLISATDRNGLEIPADLSIEQAKPGADTFLLRDFVTYGDVIRVKLPNLQQDNPAVKDQYLWIENRQQITEFDHFEFEDHACKEKGVPGIYVTLQAGKDKKTGQRIYTSSPKHPNGLGSWLMPITAEGNFDFHYRYDIKLTGGDCVWDNRSLPIQKDHPETKPNPCTGFSDPFALVNSNEDFELKFIKGNCKTDCYQPGLSEVNEAGNLVHNLNAYGDKDDAFEVGEGLSISTNPAPFPVYTYRSNPFPPTYAKKVDAYENRTIWLNGLQIGFPKAIHNTHIKANDMMVVVRWDHYSLEQDVRWCGNLKLPPHAFDKTQPALVLEEKVTLLLDRGLSPTQHLGVEEIDGQWIFTRPTQMTIEPQAVVRLKKGSKLVVDQKSKLLFSPSSKLVIDDGATIIVRSGGVLEIEDGADVVWSKPGSIDIKKSGGLILENNTQQAQFTGGQAGGLFKLNGSLEIRDTEE